ncbi:MAG: hypothetical protein IT372_35360 [Polyangiaceae bacterium]|nr:hypothetical protein [Polyangiaceae bacterium]
MRLGIRWTIGDVSQRGFEALRLSAWGAYRLFGAEAAYAVCVNTLPLEEARARAGDLPPPVAWLPAPRELPDVLRPHVDASMAEGVAWKLIPLQIFPDRHELALDNDVILWAIPPAVRAWLDDPDPSACLLAEDVRPCFGRFAPFCPSSPRNSGLRGLPPRFDLESRLRRVLERSRAPLTSELDEQGLQVAALPAAHVVPTADVAICSPFPPHQPHLGRCGAHFVGQNLRPEDPRSPPAEPALIAHWHRHRRALYARVALPLPP